MSHPDRDDADLLARARQGDATSFAVLLHRYGPAVHAVLVDPSQDGHEQVDDEDATATAALTRTFFAAMRQLGEADDQDVGRWLLRIALDEEPDPGRLARAQDPEPLPDTVLDHVWHELAVRWPTGRRPLRTPRWVGHLALLMVLLALAAGVPYVVLVSASNDEDAPPPISEVVAEPLDDEDGAARAGAGDGEDLGGGTGIGDGAEIGDGTEATDMNTASPNLGDLPDDLDRE